MTATARRPGRTRHRADPADSVAARCRGCWEAAAEAFPCVIVGMGRWGKVLAGVIADARGGGAGLVLVARSNAAEIESWAKDRAPGARVFASLEAAEAAGLLADCAQNGFGIVASDPGRHLADWRRLHEAGLPALVEKPLAAKLDEVEALANAARSGPVTGLGIEFAMLPVWPYLRSRLGDRPETIAIRWEDPPNEMRFGAVKRRHAGVSFAEDIACHAASILNHFCDIDALTVAKVATPGAGETRLALAAPGGPRIDLHLSDAGAARRRTIEIVAATGRWLVDFAGFRPTLARDGQAVAIPEPLLAFDSSLRLEIGAFLQRVRSASYETPLVDWLMPCARFHKLVALATAPGDGVRA